MMAAVTILVLSGSILFLTVVGGGLFPATVGLAAASVCLLSCLVTLRGGSPDAPEVAPAPDPRLEIILAAILIFVLITTLPLPPRLDPLAGALRHQQNQAVTLAFDQASRAGIPAPQEVPWFSLTRNRAGTLRFFLLLSGAFGAATLVSRMSSKWKLAHLHVLAVLGATVGIAGWIAQWKIPQGNTIWWILPIPPAPTSPVGCFLNRNHFGGFVAMLCPLALALADHAFTRRRWLAMMFHLGLTGVMMGVVFMSLSRGAMLAMVAGLGVVALLIAFRRSRVRGAVLIVLMLAGGLLVTSRMAPVHERLSDLHNPAGLTSVQSRLAEWRETLRVWPHYPLIGAGMNALRMVYPQYRRTSVGARLINAENEYLQLLAEGGLVGAGLAILLAVTFRRRMGNTPDSPAGVLVVGATGAMTVTGVHCLMDFPAHLPLYALVLGSIAGLLLPPLPQGLPARRRLLFSLPALIGLVGTLVILMNHPVTLKILDDPDYLHTSKYRNLYRALVWAPTSSAWLYLGHAMVREGTMRGSQELCAAGESFIARAALLDPNNYKLWYQLGETRLALNMNAEAAEAFQRAHQLRSWLTPPPIPETH